MAESTPPLLLEAKSFTSLIPLGGIAILLYFCYRWALPRPIPGIPYNKEATKSIFGDIGPMVKHSMYSLKCLSFKATLESDENCLVLLVSVSSDC